MEKKRVLLIFFAFLCVAIFMFPFDSNAEIAGHVVISEFTTRGPGGSTDEFVELYNPTNEPVDISGWAIWTYNASSLFCPTWCKRIQFPGAPGSGTTVIPPRHYLLVADSCGSYTGPAPDYWFVCTVGFKDDNGTIRLVMDSDGVNSTIDTVAWWRGHFAEGGYTAPNRGYNDDSKSIARKASAVSTEATMDPGGSEYLCGNGWDTDNNSADFFVKTTREPQGLNDPPEPLIKVVGDPNCTGVPGADYCITTNTPITINPSCNYVSVFYDNGSGMVNITGDLPFVHYFDAECFHWLNVTVVFSAPNRTVYDNETFFVDDTPPGITKTVGNPNCTITPDKEYCVTTSTKINITSSNLGCCDKITMEYRVWNGTAWAPDWTDITSQLPFTLTFTEECEHWLNITAYDCLGHRVWDNETFFVDDTYPQIQKTIGDPKRSVGCTEYNVSQDTPITINASDNGCCTNLTVEYRIWNNTNDTGWINIDIDSLPYTFTFTERCMHNLSIRAYDCLGHMIYHENQTFYVDHGPQGDSAEANQAIQNVFFTNENVYALGNGFNPNDWIDIYVVPDREWVDGDAIVPPNDVSGGFETVQSDGNGSVHVLVWPRPLTEGAYDIVYDANQDGIYDFSVDAVDGASPGFIVREELGAQVPLLSLLGTIILVTLLSLVTIVVIAKRYQ